MIEVGARDSMATVQPDLPTTEFLLIVLPDLQNPLAPNPNPGQASIAAPLLNVAPAQGPYVAYWRQVDPITDGYCEWYKIGWNQHLDIVGCGAQLDFNVIMNALSA